MRPDEDDDDFFPDPFMHDMMMDSMMHPFDMMGMHGHLEVDIPDFKNSILEDREYSNDEIVELIKDNIRQIYDPEISINIYDLGLIYSVAISDDKTVHIDMTLTSPSCPSAQELPMAVQMAAGVISKVENVTVDIVWDPPWGPEQMTDEAKLELGLL